MKKLLIVDKDAETRNALIEELSAHDSFQVAAADSAKAAAHLLRSGHIDLLITELNLPEVNGFQLLSYMKKHSPKTRAIAVTDAFSGEMVRRLNADGVSYFTKPLKIELLVNTIFEQFDHPSGSIKGIGLPSFLQFVAREQKTCTLTLSAKKSQGVIHCMNGEPIGAQSGEITGKAAFCKMVGWANPNIKIIENCLNTERQIDVPLMQLLMESHKAMDEAGGNTRGSSVPPDQDLKYKRLNVRLSNVSGISTYEILDDRDRVLNRPVSVNNTFEISPSQYFSLGNSIPGIAGGDLKYATITRSDRSSYLVAKSNPYFVRARLKPGTKPDDIIP